MSGLKNPDRVQITCTLPWVLVQDVPAAHYCQDGEACFVYRARSPAKAMSAIPKSSTSVTVVRGTFKLGNNFCVLVRRGGIRASLRRRNEAHPAYWTVPRTRGVNFRMHRTCKHAGVTRRV